MSEQAYRGILDHLPFVAFVLNADGTIVCSNPPSAKLTGKRSSELAGHGLTAALGEVEGAADIVGALAELPDAGETGLTVVVASRFRVHLRRFDADGGKLVLAVFEPLPDDEELRRRLVDADERFLQIRRTKHRMSNLVMAVLGAADSLRRQDDVGEASRKRLQSLSDHCSEMRDCVIELDCTIHGS